MIRFRSLLAAGALLSAACACTPATEEAPAQDATTDPVPVEATDVAAEVSLPPDATGFITANPLPLETDGSVRRDDYGRPYEYALLGEKLPHLTGTMMDGTPFDSDSLDKWTVIDVWGIWCGDCMRDAPYSAALASAIGQDPDLDFLSIHTPASAARTSPEEMFGKYGSLQAYFADKGYSYPVLVDTDASLRNALKISWTPSYILVAPDGTVKGYRSEFSAAKGQPIKDFIKDIARVRAETKKTELDGPTIGPGGVAGLPPGTPFTLEAVKAAFPDYKVISARLDKTGESLPVFEVRKGSVTLFTLQPDWSLARIDAISTSSPDVAGPHGERVGQVRLEDQQDAQCFPDPAGADRVLCSDAGEPQFLRVFTLDAPGATTGVMTEMVYAFQEITEGE